MVTFRINGTARTIDVEADVPLLWVLRDELGMSGTKYGCGVAQCGACTVHIDGRATRSCVLPAAALRDRDVVTIEGVSGDVARAVQDAWRRLDVAQCGYCQSGQIMSAIALLSEIRRPSDADVDAAMSGNVCRCATYVRIRAGIPEAGRRICVARTRWSFPPKMGPCGQTEGTASGLSHREGTWFLGTWAPVGYRVPRDQDVLAVCAACMGLGGPAMSRVPADVASRFGLQELASDEYGRVFSETKGLKKEK